jgi:16S rRNA processing protein RimM
MRQGVMIEHERLRDSGLVAVGRVARAQGRYGEIAVDPLTDFPDRFHLLSRVLVSDEDGELTGRTIESVRLHKGRPVLKLAGVSGIGAAQALRGKLLFIPESELAPLPEGSFYHFQVQGLVVEDRSAGEIGVVEGVLRTGGTDLLVVRAPNGEETLVPLCEPIIRRIDPERGRIRIDAPEGLVSLNAN